MLKTLDEIVETVKDIEALENPEHPLEALYTLLDSLRAEIIEYMFICGDENGEVDTLEDDEDSSDNGGIGEKALMQMLDDQDQKRNDALKRGQLMEEINEEADSSTYTVANQLLDDNGGPYDNPSE